MLPALSVWLYAIEHRTNKDSSFILIKFVHNFKYYCFYPVLESSFHKPQPIWDAWQFMVSNYDFTLEQSPTMQNADDWRGQMKTRLKSQKS